MKKTYLGDAVYVKLDQRGYVLTTENGLPTPTNIIVLEPEVMEALIAYVKDVNGVQTL